MSSWLRYRVARGDAPSDAEPLGRTHELEATPTMLDQLVSREGCLRLDLVIARLRPFEAEFTRVESTSGRGLEACVFAGNEHFFVLLRPAERHSGGLSRLAYVYSALARSRDAVVFTDSRAAILSASSRWLELYGLAPEEALGRNPRIVNARLVPRAFFRDLWRELGKRAGGSWSGELVNRRVSGELVRVWQTITAFRDSAGAVAGYLGVTRDLTQYRAVLNRAVAGARRLELARIQEEEQSAALAGRISEPVEKLRACLGRIGELAGECDETRASVASAMAWTAALEEAIRQWREERRTAVRLARGPIERFRLRALVRTECSLLEDAATERGVRIDVTDVGTALPSFGPEETLGRAISTLIRVGLEATNDDRLPVLLGSQADGTSVVAIELRPGGAEGAPRGESTSADLEARVLSSLGGEILLDFDEARTSLEELGSRVVWTSAADGALRLEAQIPIDRAALEGRIWAVSIFDPDERASTVLVEKLRSLQVPVFVAHRESDFRQVCDRELPNALVLAANQGSYVEVPRVGAGTTMFAPAVVYVTASDDPGEIVPVASTGARTLVRQLELALGRPTPRSGAT